jgi:cyclopropane-fatty-acyl-phospholipid synthase
MFCGAVLKSGDIGFAESFIAGDWTTPPHLTLLRVLVISRKEVEDMIYGTLAGPHALPHQTYAQRRNTKANSQKNIHALRFGQCVLRVGWMAR